MNSVRTHVRLPPETSPSLSGFPIDANVCKNPACEHFGLSEMDNPREKARYEYLNDKGKLKIECKRCGQRHLAYSNLSALEVFHRFLPNSIPYASCRTADCDNYYKNIFEHYHDNPKDRKEKFYRINVANDVTQQYQAKCRRCNSTFRLSSPLRLHVKNNRFWQKEIQIFIDAIVNRVGPTQVVNILRISPSRYFSQLAAVFNLLREYNNLHLAKIMAGNCAPEHMRIYTDCLVCSIKVHRDDQNHFKMKIIVSAVQQNNRMLILAFHPLFVQEVPDDYTVDTDHNQPLSKKRYAFLKHHLNRDDDDDSLPPRGLDGCLVEDYYAYLSHFLILRKMVAKVPSLHLYTDGESSLYNAALNAFSDRIRQKNCDVIVRKMDKPNKKGSSNKSSMADRFAYAILTATRAYKQANPESPKPGTHELRKFSLNQEMERVNEAITTGSTKKNGQLFPEPLSRIYKAAIRPRSKFGNEVWIVNKITDKKSPEVKLLWLTRTEDRSNADYELDLYLNGSIFYIDNVFSAIRYRSALASRSTSTATGHKNYNSSPELPVSLIQDFTVNVAFWNFFLRHKSKKKETIAYAHGLVRKPEPPDIKSIFKTRCNFAFAKRMTRWLGT